MRRKPSAVLALLSGFIYSYSAAASASESATAIERPGLHLRVGEQRILRSAGVARFSLGAPIVRSIAAPYSRDSLVLKGITAGNTDLWVWKKEGPAEHRSVTVLPARAEVPLTAPLSSALESFSALEVISLPSGTLLTGELLNLAEVNRLSVLARSAPKTLIDETTCSAGALVEARARLESWLQSTPWKRHLRIDASGSSLWLRGTLVSPKERAEALRQGRSVFARLLDDVQSMPDANPTIHFKVYLLEIRKRRLVQLGLENSGASTAGFQVTPWKIIPSLNLDLALKTLQDEGSGKILSNPELVVRAPGEAELFSGGEIPIRKTTRYGEDVDWKTFGMTLGLRVAEAVETGVRLEIRTEVSHLDPTIQIRDTPGLQANRMKTQVDARFGTPLLLSGLLQKNMHERARGLPLLSQLPVLGALFGSTEYQNDESELVAVLVPNAAPPPAPLAEMRRATAVIPFETELFDPERASPPEAPALHDAAVRAASAPFSSTGALPFGLRNGASR